MEKIIDAAGMGFAELNRLVKTSAEKKIRIERCLGQRYIACGLKDKEIFIDGTPGNALAAYLDGCRVEVAGSVQDATGDTMNAGTLIVHGSAGDATGYAMRGGKIFIEGNVGYRCGIHMKAFKENKPAIVIGGRAGSFLGEYQAGGVIVVLGESGDEKPAVGNFCGTGMHGGEIYLRSERLPALLPPQVRAERLETLPDGAAELVKSWCAFFGRKAEKYLRSAYFRLTPDSANPYKRLYTVN